MFTCEEQVDIPKTDLLSWTFERIDQFSHKPIYIDAANPRSYLTAGEAQTLVRQLIAGFGAHGVSRGDAVCILSYNQIYSTALYLGIIGAGAAFVGANPAYTSRELQHMLSVSNSKAVLVQPGLLSKLVPAAVECGIGTGSIFVLDDQDTGSAPHRVSISSSDVTPNKDTGSITDTSKFGSGEDNNQHSDEDRSIGNDRNIHGSTIPLQAPRSWRTLLTYGEESWPLLDAVQVRSTCASLLSTSGTTGLPKAAAVSHYAHIAQGELVSNSTMPRDAARVPYEVRRLISLPQFHAFTLPLVHALPLRNGQPTYIMARHRTREFVEYIERYQITETAIVPPIVQSIFDETPEAVATGAQTLSTLRCVWCAGAPLSVRLQSRMEASLHPAARFAQVWGLTEIGWISTFRYPDKGVPGSVGRLMPGMEAKIIDEHGSDIDAKDKAGEILVRGPSIMSGYLSAEAATDETLVGGWLRTGDIGYIENGNVFMIDRAKEIIKVRGWQVSPTELETVLLSHPAIADAAVVGVAATDGGEVPRAFVVPREGWRESLTATEVQQYFVGRLASFKALAGGVVFVNSIPRGGGGKVLRRLLKDETNDTAMANGSI